MEKLKKVLQFVFVDYFYTMLTVYAVIGTLYTQSAVPLITMACTVVLCLGMEKDAEGQAKRKEESDDSSD